MGFLDRLFSKKPRTASDDANNYWFEVRCRRCGEVLKGRIDMRNELSLRDNDEGFLSRKVLMGSGRCFNRIDTTFYFDSSRRLVDREISGGEFVEPGDDALDEPDADEQTTQEGS